VVSLASVIPTSFLLKYKDNLKNKTKIFDRALAASCLDSLPICHSTENFTLSC
jgi:hypothetical protein